MGWGFHDLFGWSCGCAESYDAFFGPGDAAFDDDVGVFEVAVADVSAFDVDVFGVFADFEDAFVVFYALVVAHLSCAGDAVHEVVRVPWSKGGDAAFVLATFSLQYSDAPAFHGSLPAFARCDGGYVGVLAALENLFSSDSLADEALGEFDLLWDSSAADFDFSHFRFLLG